MNSLRQQFEKERGNGITGFTFEYTQQEYINWLESRLSQPAPEVIREEYPFDSIEQRNKYTDLICDRLLNHKGGVFSGSTMQECADLIAKVRLSNQTTPAPTGETAFQEGYIAGWNDRSDDEPFGRVEAYNKFKSHKATCKTCKFDDSADTRCETCGEGYMYYELSENYPPKDDAEHSPEVMANVTDTKKPYPTKKKLEIAERDMNCFLASGETLSDLLKEPVTDCNGLKSKQEILAEQEVHQVHIKGIVYEMVKFNKALKAMQIYADQFNQQKGMK